MMKIRLIVALLFMGSLVQLPLLHLVRGTSAEARGLEEIARSVTIYRDTYGVPHVYGPTDASVVFGFVYAQAEDNFWQIEDSYIQSLGRSAEVNGEQALNADLLNRQLEIPRLSKEEYQRLSKEMQALCQATADALNYFLETHPDVKPRLITRFEPWHLIAFQRFSTYQQFIFGQARAERRGTTRGGGRGQGQAGPQCKQGRRTSPQRKQGCLCLRCGLRKPLGFQHVGRHSGEERVGPRAALHQSAPALLRTGTVV